MSDSASVQFKESLASNELTRIIPAIERLDYNISTARTQINDLMDMCYDDGGDEAVDDKFITAILRLTSTLESM